MSSEAWAVIVGEDTKDSSDGRGISLSALNADLDRLDAVAPAPAPAPAPAAHKGLLGELAGVVRSIAASGEKDITEAIAWLASHGL